MALFQPINAANLVEKQFFAPETKFNILGGVQQVIEQGRADAGAQRSQAATTAAAAGTATPEQIGLMFQQNPERALKVLEGVGVRSSQQANNVAKAAFNIRNTPFAQRGPLIQQAASRIQQGGGDPSRILAMNNMNEQQQNELATVFEQASLSVTQRTANQLDQSKLGLEERRTAAQERNVASQIGARSLTAGQKSEEFNIKRETLAIRREEQLQRALDRELSRETNQLKRDELQIKIDEKKTEIAQKKKDILFTAESSIGSIDKAIITTDQLLSGKDLEKAAGVSSLFFTTPGSDAANFEATLDTFKSQQFIQEVDKMRGLGALGEKEGERLINSAGSLNLSMSDKRLRKEIGNIQSTLKRARSKMQKKFSGIIPTSKSKPSITLESLTGDDILNMSTQELEKLMGQ